MIETILILFVFFVSGFHAGWVFREIVARHRAKQYENELSENLSKLEEHYVKTQVNLKLDKIQDVVYVYNLNDGVFICQGKTKDEIRELFRKKYPEKNGIIHEGAEYWKEML